MTAITTIKVYDEDREVIDLGSDHWWAWLVATEGDDAEKPGHTGAGWYKFTPHYIEAEDPFGGYDFHLDESGRLCYGYVSWRRYSAMKASGHVLVQVDPLTITASLACRACPSHGWIREGRWVPA